MTQHKSLKRRVRARMTKTGESYAAARQRLLAKAPSAMPSTATEPVPPEAVEAPLEATAPPEAEAPASSEATVEPAAGTAFRGERQNSDEVLIVRTGRPWGAWLALLEAWGAADRPHPEIARWLGSEHGVDGWWAQELTVRFEMAIGRRRPGERPNGFAVSASKTVAVPVERLFEAFVDDRLRAEWLPGVVLRLRTATPHRTARFDWEDGATRIAVGFTARGDARSTAALEHERLPDAGAADRQKAFWRDRLQELQRLLEG